MKPTNLTDLKNRAVQQAIETIRNRIDQLGVSEPMIEEHGLGQYQILVQLPGIDDPARVKQVMQSTAMLEIRQVMGGPYPSQEAALQDKGGVMPEDSMLMPGKTNPDGTQTWYFVSRIPAVTGKDLRAAIDADALWLAKRAAAGILLRQIQRFEFRQLRFSGGAFLDCAENAQPHPPSRVRL
jgi:preprotein translocase subunit SecD